MKPKEKQKDLPMTPLTKEEIQERAEQLYALTRRIPKITQALEVEGVRYYNVYQNFIRRKIPIRAYFECLF